MNTPDNAKAMADIISDLDALDVQKKAWLLDWRLRKETLLTDLHMRAEDARQMRLGEPEGEAIDIRKAGRR